MFEIPCLIIDELGGGHDPSRVGVDKLCQVLSKRESMWTLITTNLLPAAWEEAFDRRVSSRFFRNSTLVDLSDVPDFGTI
jgi:DNA replication protein DnaC